ncbi:hypothetical protein [Ekhidna sp. To15]|uniref:hypothetical protein n=1 Tax=Ekhidna sp. To15 TaxID=3395267 RepID=UPI003F51B4A4
MYKIVDNHKEQETDNMQFVISDYEYIISRNDSLNEKGNVLVDTRHQKINFENKETSWKVRFVWDELRLENQELALEYRLRRY